MLLGPAVLSSLLLLPLFCEARCPLPPPLPPRTPPPLPTDGMMDTQVANYLRLPSHAAMPMASVPQPNAISIGGTCECGELACADSVL